MMWLASCDRFQPNEAAATVNGHEISLAQLEELAEGNDDPAVLRASLTAWIQVVAASDDPGELLTEADLAAQRAIVIPPLIESTRDQAREQYEQGLDGSPLLCLAVIPLAADTESGTVLRAYAVGVPFGDLAAEYSDDPSLIETGGIISVDGQECLPIEQWNLELLDQLRTEEVAVGTPGVIVLNDAEVVVLLRPYDELTTESQSSLAQGPVSDALLALYQSAEVRVNESVGAWDPEQGLVVEAGEAASDH
jgi:hypothetical protein